MIWCQRRFGHPGCVTAFSHLATYQSVRGPLQRLLARHLESVVSRATARQQSRIWRRGNLLIPPRRCEPLVSCHIPPWLLIDVVRNPRRFPATATICLLQPLPWHLWRCPIGRLRVTLCSPGLKSRKCLITSSPGAGD